MLGIKDWLKHPPKDKFYLTVNPCDHLEPCSCPPYAIRSTDGLIVEVLSDKDSALALVDQLNGVSTVDKVEITNQYIINTADLPTMGKAPFEQPSYKLLWNEETAQFELYRDFVYYKEKSGLVIKSANMNVIWRKRIEDAKEHGVTEIWI